MVFEIAPNKGTRIVRSVELSAGGNGAKFKRRGWTETSRGSVACSGATFSLPLFSNPTAAAHIVVTHFTPTDHCLIQVLIDGITVFSGLIDEEIVLGFPVAYVDSRNLTIEFVFPDLSTGKGAIVHALWVFACADLPWNTTVRRLPSALAPGCDGINPPVLLGRFESLGHSCDFGFLQREIGIEPLGLFRWSGISTACAFKGIVNRFKPKPDRDALDVYLLPGSADFTVVELNYHIHFHTFLSSTETTREALLERDRRRVPFLQKKFLEEIDLAEKIFLLKRPRAIFDNEALAIWAALNLWGRNVLLYVSPNYEVEPGTVDVVGTRLFRGHVDSAVDVAPSQEAWLSVCAHATHLAAAGHPLPRRF